MDGFLCKTLTRYEIFCDKQKTAYEMRIRDWSSDVCSSDLRVTKANNRQTMVQAVMFFSFLATTVGPSTWLLSLFDGLNKPASWGWTIAGLPCIGPAIRSEARSVGRECVSKGRYRWLPRH